MARPFAKKVKSKKVVYRGKPKNKREVKRTAAVARKHGNKAGAPVSQPQPPVATSPAPKAEQPSPTQGMPASAD